MDDQPIRGRALLFLYYDASEEQKKCSKSSSTVVSQVKDRMVCELFHSQQNGAIPLNKLSFAVRTVLFIK